MTAIAHLHPVDTTLGGAWCVSSHVHGKYFYNKYLVLKECVSREKAMSVGRLLLRNAG